MLLRCLRVFPHSFRYTCCPVWLVTVSVFRFILPHLWHLDLDWSRPSCRLVDTGTYSTDIIGYSPCFVMVHTALVQWRDCFHHCCFVIVEWSSGWLGWIFDKHMLLITIYISHTFYFNEGWSLDTLYHICDVNGKWLPCEYGLLTS